MTPAGVSGLMDRRPHAHPRPEVDTAITVQIRLLLASFLALFTELALIRYLPGHVPVLAYFTNAVLIASFFGLGLGFLLTSSTRSYARVYLPLVLLAVVLAKGFERFAVVKNAIDTREPFWIAFVAPADRIELPMGFVVLAAFAVVTFVCVPVGQIMGRCFAELERLGAYHFDLLGSLAGVLVFAAFGGLHTGPVVWFSLMGVIALILFYDRHRSSGVIVGAVIVATVAWEAGDRETWSSYYRINSFAVANGTTLIEANRAFHQMMLDIEQDDDYTSITRDRFELPYRVLAEHSPGIDLANPQHCVLIVGAGSGNDVAVALAQGARCIHAVEIDRAFVELGQDRHPQQPYADPAVSVIVDDARAYFSRARGEATRYALILFGTLDSLALTGGHSTRLDSYVYTRESFEAAFDLLEPGGMLGVYHLSQRPYIAQRIHNLLARLDGQRPQVHALNPHTLFNHVFVKSKAVDLGAGSLDAADRERITALGLPSDNWPFLFLARGGIPGHYVVVLAGIIVFVLASVALCYRRAAPSFDAGLFFLGAGFLLLETKSVTQMSLLFGSTWVVNVLVFAAILGLLLCANAYVRRRGATVPPNRVALLFGALIMLLVALSYLPLRWLTAQADVVQWAVAIAIVGMPVALAGLVFPVLFAQARDTRGAFASNLLGAVTGGLLEYSVMLLGIAAMSQLAALLYFGAFGCWLVRARMNGG